MWALALNVLIAVIWLLLSSKPSLATFALGYALGLILLAVFRGVLPEQRYLPRLAGFLHFLVLFGGQFVGANLQMARLVLFRRRDALEPNLITLDVADLKPWEILLLSHCITLTPGTSTVQVSPDYRTLLIHALDAARPDEVRQQINRTLRTAILRFTR